MKEKVGNAEEDELISEEEEEGEVHLDEQGNVVENQSQESEQVRETETGTERDVGDYPHVIS